MTRLLGLLAVAGLLAATPAVAQGPPDSSADSFFHEGAQAYVAGNRAAARRAVEEGLSVAPGDPRLEALRQKLEQEGQPQSPADSAQANDQEQSQQNANSSSSEASEEGQDDPSESEEAGDAQSGPRDQSAAESSQPGPQSSAGASSGGGRDAPPRPRDGGPPVDTLSRAQAERLLRALEGQERRLLRRLQTRSADRRSVEKDW
jgi:hypothetical protein